MEIEFIKISESKSEEKGNIIYKIVSKMNNNPINLMIKLINVRLPFDMQKYNNNLYLNLELFTTDKQYDDNLKKISSLEHFLKDKFEILTKNTKNTITNNISFISSIKHRSKDHLHIKTMCKRVGKNLMLTINDEIDLYKLKEVHLEFDYRYNVEIKPEFIWCNDDAYGINFIISSIIKSDKIL